MNAFVFLKWLWETKVITMAPGVASLIVLGYVEFFQLMPLQAEVTGVKDAVEELQLSQYETKLDAAYAALCMNPGDPAVLERIRELQQAYERVAGRKYIPPTCDLLFKLK
jgi:hypothetical protein